MLTSCFIKFATAKIDAFCSSFSTGIIIFCKGWRTLIFSFARRDNTREEIICASSILRSNDLSMYDFSNTGKSAKCMLSKFSFLETAFKSKYNLSIKNGAIGALIFAIVSIQVYKV